MRAVFQGAEGRVGQVDQLEDVLCDLEEGIVTSELHRDA